MGILLKPEFKVVGRGITVNRETVTILGCGDTLWNDIAKYGVVGDVMVISDVLMYFDGIVHHYVSKHNDVTGCFLDVRRSRLGHLTKHEDIMFHGILEEHQYPVTHRWIITPNPVDSGHFAVFIAICIGYENIRLLGMPLYGGRFYKPDPPDRLQDRYRVYHRNWRETARYMVNVRSASGFTAELLGEIQ